MTPRALLFDLDGTLTDSIGLIVHCYQATVRKFLGIELTYEDVVPVIGRSLLELYQELSPEHWESMVAFYRETYAALADEWVTIYPGISEMMAALTLPVGVVTSKGADSAVPVLTRFGLIEGLATLVTFEDTTRHKPEPAPLLFAAERLCLSPTDCWYIGDSTHDMKAARAAGMRAIGALWGPSSREELAPLADDLLENPAMLGKMLL
ncbi:MAG: HAD-IA family hydrolase [Armatimonas sp.]